VGVCTAHSRALCRAAAVPQRHAAQLSAVVRCSLYRGICWSCCWPCCTCCCWFAREPPIVAPWTYRTEKEIHRERFTVHIDCLLAAIEAEARCVLRGLRCRAYSRYPGEVAVVWSRVCGGTQPATRVFSAATTLLNTPRAPHKPTAVATCHHRRHCLANPTTLPSNTAHTLLSPLKPTCLVRRES